MIHGSTATGHMVTMEVIWPQIHLAYLSYYFDIYRCSSPPFKQKESGASNLCRREERFMWGSFRKITWENFEKGNWCGGRMRTLKRGKMQTFRVSLSFKWSGKVLRTASPQSEERDGFVIMNILECVTTCSLNSITPNMCLTHLTFGSQGLTSLNTYQHHCDKHCCCGYKISL